jgi:hypothetical protein
MVALFLFFKGMMGALAPLSYLVVKLSKSFIAVLTKNKGY